MSNTREDSPVEPGSKACPAGRWAGQFHLRKRVLAPGCVALLLGILATVFFYHRRAVIEASIDRSPPPRPDVDAPFITTPQDVVEKMLELARLTEDDLVYDLGCGDGRIVVAAARKYGCRAVGVDKDPERVRESLENVKKGQVEHLVEIAQQDIFTLDLSEADVVTIYLLPRLNVKLIPQLEKMKPGARIIAHDFDIEGVRPDETITIVSGEDNQEHYIYVFVSPIKRQQSPGGASGRRGA